MPSSVRVFLAPEPVDLRAGAYRLAARVRGHFGADPKSGHVYAFVNRSRTLTKLVFWDRRGYCLLTKRLEAGRYCLPNDLPADTVQVEMDASALTLFLDGIDLTQAIRQPSYTPPDA